MSQRKQVSRTGKRLCNQCRRLATSRLSCRSWPSGRFGTPETRSVYHCDAHRTQYDEPLSSALA